MTAPRFAFQPGGYRPARPETGSRRSKNPARIGADHQWKSRKWFADLLWRAFPSVSENELASKAARALDCSPRQVRNWLRCEHDAGLQYVTAVLILAGFETLIFGSDRGRK